MGNPSHPVARVYAAALTEIGRGGDMGKIHEDLSAVAHLYDTDLWFRQFFTSPRIDRSVKWKAVEKAFKGHVGRPVLHPLALLYVASGSAMISATLRVPKP